MIQSSSPANTSFSTVRQDQHLLRLSGRLLCPGDQFYAATVCVGDNRPLRRCLFFSLHVLICAGLLVSAGCGQKSGPREYSDAEAKAQRDELLKRFPEASPDTPEQIQQKEATVAESLPKVYELLEQAKLDPKKNDEAVELSMSLAALLPGHRAAEVAWLKAQLASFLAKEATGKDGRIIDAHNMAVAIRSAAPGAQNFKKKHPDLSEDEVQLCQEIFFNRARLEGLDHQGEDSTSSFNEAIGDLMRLEFSDAERLKTEPRFKNFFANPKTAPVLQAAIVQIEGSAKDVPETDTSEVEASPKPE